MNEAAAPPTPTPTSPRLPWWLLAFGPLPAVCFGAFVAQRAGVSAFAFAPNVAALLLGALLLAIASRCSPSARDRIVPVAALVATALIVRTLLQPGLQGVFRWMPLGPMRLHVSMALAPFVAIAFARASHRGDVLQTRLFAGLAITAQIAHVAQPDAQQAFTLAVGLAPLMLLDRVSPRWSRASWTCLGVLAIASLWRPDALAPLPHVERILGLALTQGTWVFAVAAASVLWMLSPFVLLASETGPRWKLALAGTLWLVTQLVATAFGAFPVPVLGAGAAGVLGVAAWLAALQGSRREIHAAPTAQAAEPAP